MPLEPVTLHDSDQAATSNRHTLDIDRHTAAALGHDTIRAIRLGSYLLSDGTRVDWSAAVAEAVAAKVSIPPDATLPAGSSNLATTTTLTVANETTLNAARRLVVVPRKVVIG